VPEILIVDEVLSVGDVSFTRKCEARMQEFRRAGVTLVLVTHSQATMIDNCTRCVWLDGGRIVAVGPPEDTWRRYAGAGTAGDGGPRTAADQSPPTRSPAAGHERAY
jgi:ABC-type polysaccharide/polyol phosphate transport system ATPase subunit